MSVLTDLNLMIKKLRTFKASLVAILLVALSSVFVCDFLCDVGLIEISLHGHQTEVFVDRRDSSNSSTFQPHGDDAHHHPSHQHQLERNSKSSHNHSGSDHHHDLLTTVHYHEDQQQNTEQDDCCEEETNALFSSLLKHQPKALDLKTKYFQLSAIDFHLEKIVVFNSVVPSGEIYLLDLPPPSSWDIRILIQSFLN